jgi:hypothetical protein
VNALREVNITVQRATADFEAAGKRYPAGSFVIPAAQAFRPHVLDMFEPQDHPNVIPYPGAPPTPPYDNAGWTLAYQMGIEFDRVLTAITPAFERVTTWNVAPPPGRVTATDGRGFLFTPQQNDAATAINRLLAAGDEVYAGPRVYVAAGQGTSDRVRQIARTLGVNFLATPDGPGELRKLARPRIGLWDQYGGSMESGWTRWILEQFEFSFDRTFPPKLDAGNLAASYDVLIFPNGGIPATSGGGGRGGRGGAPPADGTLPPEYRDQIGRVTADRTIPQLRAFVEAGGTIVAIGDAAANLAAHFKLPLDDHLVEKGAPLPRATYFVPGSVLTARVDVTHPLAAGMRERTDFFFDNSPVFKLRPEAAASGVRVIAAFDSPAPLRSGWAWGQKYLDGGVIAVDVAVGKGRVVLFGPEILQRAQPHGTFKLLFNAIFAASAR